MTDIVLICVATLGAFAFLRLIYVEAEELRVAETRQRLFELRDKLFELGREGTIPFGSDAYVFSRQMINGMIRFAHDLSLTRLVLGRVFASRRASGRTSMYQEAKGRAVAGLSKSSRPAFDAIQSKIDYWASVHVLKGSLLMLVGSAIAGLLIFVRIIFRDAGKAYRASAQRRRDIRVRQRKISSFSPSSLGDHPIDTSQLPDILAAEFAKRALNRARVLRVADSEAFAVGRSRIDQSELCAA